MGQFRVAVRNGVLPERYVQLPVNYYGEVHMKHITRLSTLLLAVMLYLSDTNAQQSWTRSSNSAKDQTHLQVGALFKFIKTVHVTPDTNFHSAGFARVGYVPATNNLVVTFGGKFNHPINGLDHGVAYKEHNLDMQATGKAGALFMEDGDIGELIVDNMFYAVSQDFVGWHILKYDAVTWSKLVDIKFPLDSNELSGDMIPAFVNGQLDISSQCLVSGHMADPDSGATTTHHFFSPDLILQGKRLLSDTPHITGSTMIYVAGIYYFISATAYTGDVIVMKYDSNWKYLGMKKLMKQAHWSEGVAFDGQRFYVSYLNTSQRTNPGFFPYYPNVHLAAFDRDWNLISDTAVTNFTPSDSMFTGRPSLLMRGNRIYVSYDVVPLPEDLDKIEAWVSVYDLNPDFTSIEQSGEIIKGFQLEQNYPNPFNPSTRIEFQLPHSSFVSLKVFDILGRQVTILLEKHLIAGKHSIDWNASCTQSGIYFYRLQAGDYTETKKLILLQ